MGVVTLQSKKPESPEKGGKRVDQPQDKEPQASENHSHVTHNHATNFVK